MSLRRRLFAAFLALALIPTAVLTFFTLDRLGRAIALWNTPGVDRAFDAAIQTTKSAVARLETTALAQAGDWARALPPAPWPEARRAEIQAGLRAAGLDFVQAYRREDGAWRLVDELRPGRVLAPAPVDLAGALAGLEPGEHLLRTPDGVLAALAPCADGTLLATGLQLGSGFFDDVARVGEGAGFYRRFGVVRDVSRTYTWLLVVALALVLVVVAAWASAALARSLTRPLQRLEGAVARVAAGELEVRVEPEGAREVVALGERFNAMTERLAAAQASLRAAEREAASREVARRLAHEFKNILTPLPLSLHRLRRRAELVPESERPAVRESLDAFAAGVEQLTRLAGQFAQYARLPEPRLERMDLARVAREATRLHEPEAVELAFQGGEMPSWIHGDPLLLSRAIHNLVPNACEASPPGARVEVAIGEDGTQAYVEVLDRGPGLAPEVRERLFEPYVSTKRRGSGLGLSLIRDIALQHHGAIDLEDREGGGTRARLRLPRDPSPPREKGAS